MAKAKAEVVEKVEEVAEEKEKAFSYFLLFRTSRIPDSR